MDGELTDHEEGTYEYTSHTPWRKLRDVERGRALNHTSDKLHHEARRREGLPVGGADLQDDSEHHEEDGGPDDCAATKVVGDRGRRKLSNDLGGGAAGIPTDLGQDGSTGGAEDIHCDGLGSDGVFATILIPIAHGIGERLRADKTADDGRVCTQNKGIELE